MKSRDRPPFHCTESDPFWVAVCWWILEADPILGGCMLMNSRGGPPFREGSASRDNFYGSSGTCPLLQCEKQNIGESHSLTFYKHEWNEKTELTLRVNDRIFVSRQYLQLVGQAMAWDPNFSAWTFWPLWPLQTFTKFLLDLLCGSTVQIFVEITNFLILCIKGWIASSFNFASIEKFNKSKLWS